MANPILILLDTLLELFYPSNCVGCGHPQDFGCLLCEQCRETSPRIRPPFCRRCSRPFEGLIEGEFSCPNCEDRAPAFDCVVSIYQAKGVLRDLIHRFKYGRQFHLAPCPRPISRRSHARLANTSNSRRLPRAGPSSPDPIARTRI